MAGERRLGRLAAVSGRHARWGLAGWLLLAAGLTPAVPRVETVVADDAPPFLPAGSPSIQAFERMDRAFGQGGGESIAFVVLSAPGFADSSADQAYYRSLVHRLRQDDAHVVDLQEYATRPQLRDALVSDDGD